MKGVVDELQRALIEVSIGVYWQGVCRLKAELRTKPNSRTTLRPGGAVLEVPRQRLVGRGIPDEATSR